MKLTWLHTSRAAPSSGTFCTPSTRTRYSVFTSTQVMKRIKNSGTSVKMYQATSTLSSDAARKICDASMPSAPNPRPKPAASTISSAFRMLVPAMIRDSFSLGARACTKANSGTT